MKQEIHQIFETWNRMSEIGHWVKHRKITPDIVIAIKKMLAMGWETEDMRTAICNYAEVVHSRKTRWTYNKWSLSQFFTRGFKGEELKWVKFHPNSYRFNDWLTPDAVKELMESKREQARRTEKVAEKKAHVPVTKEQKAKIRAEGRL